MEPCVPSASLPVWGFSHFHIRIYFSAVKAVLQKGKEWGGSKWYVNKLCSQLYLQVSPLALLGDISVLSTVCHSLMCGNLSPQSELSFC